jgi:hypothetical protein
MHGDDFADMQEKRKVVTTDGYSFKPFDDTRSLFVHIPKCAGVSVCRALYGNLAGGHTTFDRYLRVFEPGAMLRYFKFTIVRNPWDRLVSSYHFLRIGGFNDQDQRWFDEELGRYRDFDDFVKSWLSEENSWKWPHFRPQYSYILEKHEKLDLDFIGLMENIEDDFSFIAERIGSGCSLAKLNQSEHEDYASYYSDETRDIVARVYRQDIDLLGYDFRNENVPRMLEIRNSKLKGPRKRRASQ